ncbi:MAG TPA: DNA mismatch repair endonuclease MutL [bacterium]|nr:DNA mismatch repair endonuclease MutL [bacterium]HMW34904.1 DNA mismatch repair endonuclease MutL [bacterium]HMY35738.1 DNA mismatch repair endonuclease MutL [bacterium]HMZ05174.1 DNA mismatch repair endonuclease MutL [bacterium]HNB55963.1 DNA mismatch repair endonuclease MutL [bacterium]
MENRIQILPDHIANKIAAGEVVERPASVVKELVENSLDAGADEVTITVRSGGKDLVQVIDNGKGMTQDDAVLCFERHATSKIRQWEDLLKVQSFGFRGEALASIASVSDIELKTRMPDQEVGTLVQLHAGKLNNVTQEASLPGTTITVKNLFYNVPARRNFLKTNTTEFRHIAGVIKRFAIAYPAVEFTLIHDDEKIFQLRKTDLYGRLEKVIGREIMSYTLPLMADQFGVKIHGYVSKPSFSYKTKGEQFLFVNGRPIVNRTANFSVASAYGHTIPKGDKPFFVLFLEWNSEEFDVNVHPTKAEVKFKDEQLLYRVVFHAVRDTMNTDVMIPSLTQSHPMHSSSNDIRTSDGTAMMLELNTQRQPLQWTTPAHSNTAPQPTSDEAVAQFFSAEETAPSPKSYIQDQLVKRIPVNLNSMVWQLHNRYIVSQIKSGLAIIDQHVAHERILYERALDAFEHNPIFSQQLLFPQTIEFSPEDFSIIEKHIALMERLGFVVKVFGKRTLVVEAVPADVRLGNEQKILTEIIREYKEHEHDAMDPRDNLAKSFACKSAIKSGDPLNVDEMNGLIDQLFACKFPYVCPHGRPIIIQLTLDELDKRFMRT